MKKIFFAILCFTLILAADEADKSYELGRGFKISNTNLYLGGYTTTHYVRLGNNESLFTHDDTAFMLYGDLTDRLSTMIEFETSPTYAKTYGAPGNPEVINRTPKAERLYLDYVLNDTYTVRLGQFLTYAGIWNETPIAVLRDSHSSPKVVEMFPRLTSGVALFSNINDSTQAWVFLQANRPIEKEFNNIETHSFYGAKIERSWDDSRAALSFGRYKQKDRVPSPAFGQSPPDKLQHAIYADEGNRNSSSGDSKVNYADISFQYSKDRLKLMFEGFVGTKEQDTTAGVQKGMLRGYYAQATYRAFEKNYAIIRTEGAEETLKRQRTTPLSLGWNYKPHDAVSIKLERHYDYRGGGALSAISISILF